MRRDDRRRRPRARAGADAGRHRGRLGGVGGRGRGPRRRAGRATAWASPGRWAPRPRAWRSSTARAGPRELVAPLPAPAPAAGCGAGAGSAGASAMLDLSDGLASDARRLAEASGVRIELDAAALPLAKGVAEVAAALGVSPAELGATGGEDYELCACIAGSGDVAGLTWIGEVVEGPPEVVWRGAPPGAERLAGVRARLVRASRSLVALVGQQQSLEDRRGDSLAVHLVRPALECSLGAVALWSPHHPWEGAMGTSARSAVHRREPGPSPGLALRIGCPAPSYERYRPQTDNGRWGRRPMSRRGAAGGRSDEPREHDDPLGRRIQRVARGEDQPIVGHALRDPDGGRRDDPRALDACR